MVYLLLSMSHWYLLMQLRALLSKARHNQSALASYPSAFGVGRIEFSDIKRLLDPRDTEHKTEHKVFKDAAYQFSKLLLASSHERVSHYDSVYV